MNILIFWRTQTILLIYSKVMEPTHMAEYYYGILKVKALEFKFLDCNFCVVSMQLHG